MDYVKFLYDKEVETQPTKITKELKNQILSAIEKNLRWLKQIAAGDFSDIRWYLRILVEGKRPSVSWLCQCFAHMTNWTEGYETEALRIKMFKYDPKKMTDLDWKKLVEIWNEFGETIATFKYLEMKGISTDPEPYDGYARFVNGYVVKSGHNQVNDFKYYFFREDLYVSASKMGLVFNAAPDYDKYPKPEPKNETRYLDFVRY